MTTEFTSLREKIAAETAARKARYATFEEVWKDAYVAGVVAAQATTPRAMVVAETQPGGRSWYVPDGVCGFAWVKVRRGNSSFATWLKKTGKARPSYYGGVEVRIGEYGQSMERKEAHARAMAKVFCEKLPGVEAYADSRMD